MANSEVNSVLEKVRELEIALTCSDCDQIFSNPVIIGRCGHTFCQSCVMKYSGKFCPTCKVPVTNKDSHDDKQLHELLTLVQQLKLILKDSAADNENQSSDKQQDTTISETPLQNLQSKSKNENDQVIPPSVKRVYRVKRKVKCHDPECCNSPRECSTPLKLKKSGTSTPSNVVVRKRSALTSPIVRKLKRSPFRSFHSFSAGKHLSNRLKSPRANPASPMTISASLEKKNAKGETSLHVAVIKGDVERVTMLLSKKANPNVQDNAGWTPLHEASNHGYMKITKLLFEHGAAVDVPGPDNITPLYDALVNGKIEVAKFLVSKEADLNAKVDQGSTVLDLCTDKNLKAELLEISNNCKKAKEVVRKTRSPQEKGKFVLLSTSLANPTQQEGLQKCVDNILKAEMVTDFTPAVTHIVTCLDNGGQCNRTLKILRAILSGKWIVDFKWIEACLKQKKRVPEDEFEAHGTRQQPNCQGPTRARYNMLKQFPPLFQDCNFYLYGQFNPPLPSKADITQLIQMGGGKIIVREPKPEMVEVETFHSPYHAEGGPLSDMCYFILYQDKPPRQTQTRANHICTVSFDWFINSICAFTLLEPNFVSNN